MADPLIVFVNGERVIEYDRNRRLPGHQRRFLDQMDEDMSAGIMLDSEFIAQPDQEARMNYVAMKLVQAAQSGNTSLIAATGTYLSRRYQTLKEIRASEAGEEISLTFVFARHA